MKIQILSDLHIKFNPFDLEEIDRDLLILAGDICEGKSAKWFIELQLKYSPVIFVLGNHEYYSYHMDKIIQYWKNLNIEGLYVLERDSVELDGVNFFGCTLWSDMAREDPITKAFSKAEIKDYKLIWKDGHLLTPERTIQIHFETVKWLDDRLTRTKGKKIVISHFLPSLKSLHPRYKDLKYAGYYYSDLDGLIEKTQPDFWIHGHIHNSMDYTIGNTRIICNPKGYENENPNPLFNPAKVIEI